MGRRKKKQNHVSEDPLERKVRKDSRPCPTAQWDWQERKPKTVNHPNLNLILLICEMGIICCATFFIQLLKKPNAMSLEVL